MALKTERDARVITVWLLM